ncbi:MAG TPA: guanylate kinase [Bacteroidales bacterium]|nr:guanylate kinase [Bacteroidales bacterium]
MSGKMIIVSAPSGAGKSTLVRHLLDTGLPLEFSISATSRKPRGEEKNGREYYFLPTDEFRKRIENDEFIEWEEVYKDHFYGTLKSEIKRILDNGNYPLFDVDVQGGVNLKNIFGRDAMSIFIMPPSVEELENRLRKRATDTEDKIKMRVGKAAEEMTLADKFDVIIINDDLVKASEEIARVVSGFIDNR